jgi:sensor histidine kinase YesM
MRFADQLTPNPLPVKTGCSRYKSGCWQTLYSKNQIKPVRSGYTSDSFTMIARFILLFCCQIAHIGQAGALLLAPSGTGANGQAMPWSLDDLVSGISLVDKSLLHFAYLCAIMGLCLFLGLFALVQGTYSRDPTYWYWGFYLWSNFALFFTAVVFTYRFDLLGPVIRPWSSVAQYVVQLAYLLFISSFLAIKQNHPAIHRLIVLFSGLLVLGLLYAIWAMSQVEVTRYFLDYADGFTFFTDILLLLLFVRIVKSGIPQTRLLIIGSAGVLLSAVVAAVVDIFNLTQIGSYVFDPVVIFSVGVLFELTLFSLALSQRTRLVRAENQRLQRNYTRQLEQDLSERVHLIQEQSRLIDDERLQRLTNDFNQKIAETEMAALRAQMNPHFIFNCLNSIQFFTAQNDADKATDYLTKFSRLIRLVLENSKSERVTLQNELETLRLYLDMEAMRFAQKVHYEIQLADNIDAESIQIPPLLLQPFVENAIWHGLMHKDEGGLVRVSVAQPQANRLRIEISDNGVGRAKAAEYKSKSATKNKSFGLKMTADRIELINQLYHTRTEVQVDDLVDERGQPTGTRVVVEIPV